MNATTGAATAAGLGTAIITATKAADANYTAQSSYMVNVQTADSVHAWVGERLGGIPARVRERKAVRARADR